MSKKTVTFGDNQEHEIELIPEDCLSQVFYGQKELNKVRMADQRDALRGGPNVCLRGMEKEFSSSSLFSQREKHFMAVSKEWHRQQSHGHHDLAQLRKISQKYSQDDTQRAQALAAQDEADAFLGLGIQPRKDTTSSPASSPMKPKKLISSPLKMLSHKLSLYTSSSKPRQLTNASA